MHREAPGEGLKLCWVCKWADEGARVEILFSMQGQVLRADGLGVTTAQRFPSPPRLAGVVTPAPSPFLPVPGAVGLCFDPARRAGYDTTLTPQYTGPRPCPPSSTAPGPSCAWRS